MNVFTEIPGGAKRKAKHKGLLRLKASFTNVIITDDLAHKKQENLFALCLIKINHNHPAIAYLPTFYFSVNKI